MNLCIIRPPMIYGLGAKGNPLIIEILSRFTSLFPETFNRRSFLYIVHLIKILFDQLFSRENIILNPQDPQYLSMFQLFR